MRTGAIVLAQPLSDDDVGLVDAREPLSVEHLAAERTVEPLVISILPRRAREDPDRLNPNPPRPGLQGVGDELRPVVGA